MPREEMAQIKASFIAAYVSLREKKGRKDIVNSNGRR